jgi:hypothetical protein
VENAVKLPRCVPVARSSELVDFLLMRTVVSEMKVKKRYNRRKEGRKQVGLYIKKIIQKIKDVK